MTHASDSAIVPAIREKGPRAEHARAYGGWVAGAALGPGGIRRYYVYQPPGLLPDEGPLPLVVMLHGCGQDAHGFARITRMNELAAKERYFVLFPEQERLANSKGCWNWYERQSGIADAEAATLMVAINQVCAHFLVDRGRIAVAGLSAGASMANLMAVRYPRRFQAVAMHSGVASGAGMSSLAALGAMRGEQGQSLLISAVGKAMSAAASFASLPPLMVLHGDADEVVDPSNASNSAAIWAMASNAKAGTERTLNVESRTMRETEFKRADRTLVRLCRVAGLRHAWSGGAPELPFSDPAGPNATRLIWAFVRRQFSPTNV
jgi:poly(hydroxyalkanoate) depolymerase family esterase